MTLDCISICTIINTVTNVTSTNIFSESIWTDNEVNFETLNVGVNQSFDVLIKAIEIQLLHNYF